MKSIIAITAIALMACLGGCVSVPPSVSYNGKEIPAVNPVTFGCNEPYALEQDCSGISGATRRITFEGHPVKIAGSADGTVVLIMGPKALGVETMKLTIATSAIESFLIAQGLTVVEQVAGAANDEVFFYILVFDGNAYDLLKPFTDETE